MATSAKDITFVIPGQAQPAVTAAGATRGPAQGTVKASVRVGAQRGSGEAVRVTARPGEDVVVLTIANGPTLVLHPEDARDLMRAQNPGATRSAIDAAHDDEVMVGAQLGWPGLEAVATRGVTRGWMGQAVLSAFEVVTDLLKDPAVSLATAAITKKVDDGVEAGRSLQCHWWHRPGNVPFTNRTEIWRPAESSRRCANIAPRSTRPG